MTAPFLLACTQVIALAGDPQANLADTSLPRMIFSRPFGGFPLRGRSRNAHH